MMDVDLLVHLEDGEEGVVWWAESPQLAGFSAADDSLTQLLAAATRAVADILAEGGESASRISVQLVPTEPIEPVMGNPTRQLDSSGRPTYDPGADARVTALVG